jgi:hypothetical protein
MASNVVPFRDPSLPAAGAEGLAIRRKYRAGCKAIATKSVSQAFEESFKLPGIGKLNADHAYPLFVAAMRRELRKSGLF